MTKDEADYIIKEIDEYTQQECKKQALLFAECLLRKDEIHNNNFK